MHSSISPKCTWPWLRCLPRAARRTASPTKAGTGPRWRATNRRWNYCPWASNAPGFAPASTWAFRWTSPPANSSATAATTWRQKSAASRAPNGSPSSASGCRPNPSYPIIAIEDPASEHDPIGMRSATAAFAARALIVGDDYLVSDPQRIATAAREGACNTALIKVNQAGTVTRAWQAHAAARAAGWATIVSARSGESEDVSVAHLAVGWGADLIKVGAITRGERTAKWNEMLRIDEELGGLPLAPFPLR